MITRRFEFVGGGSRKFWEVRYPENGEDGTSTWSCRWGRIGTTGQMKSFACAGWIAAKRDAIEKIDEKLLKGYVERIAGGNVAAALAKCAGLAHTRAASVKDAQDLIVQSKITPPAKRKITLE